MINEKTSNGIPELCINDFNKNSSGFCIITVEELQKEFHQIVFNSHRLTYYQLVLITGGSGFFRIDMKKYNLKPRTLFPVSKGQIENIELADNVNGFAILFSDEFICKYPDDFAWINNLQLFNHQSDSLLIDLSEPEYEELLILLKKMGLDFKTEDDFAKDEILLNSLKTFILKAERIKRFKMQDETIDVGDLSYLIKFKKMLEENFGCSRSVSFYSDSLNITCKKLNQVTSQYWGKPAKQVIEERVLLETKRLLIHTCQSIKEIGNSLGFIDPTNFNKFFKKYAKVTPAEFRTSKKKYLYHKTALNNHSH